MCRFNENNMGHLKFTVNCPSANLPKWIRTSSQGYSCMDLLIQPVCFLFLWQRVKEHLSCLKLRISTDYEMMMPLLFPLTIPSSQLQRSVHFSVLINTDGSSSIDFLFPDMGTYCYSFWADASFICAAVRCHVSTRCLSATEESSSLRRCTESGPGKQGAI